MTDLTLNQKLHKDRERLLRFCAAHKNIRILGSGDLALLMYRYLTDEGIDVQDFIIPDNEYTSDTHLDHPAYMFSRAEYTGEDGIILAIESWMQGYVISNLALKMVFYQQIFQQSIYGHFTDMTVDRSNTLPGYVGNSAPEGYFARYTELNEIGKKYKTDKSDGVHNYLNKYEFFLNRWKDETFTLLELGIFRGASLKTWREYFTKAHIVAVDIDPACASMGEENTEIIIDDLSLDETLESLKRYAPAVINDDASHIWSHQIKSLCHLFPVLPHGGVFIMEDLETSFSAYKFQNYDDAPISCYSFLSAVAEVVTGGEYLDSDTRSACLSLFRPEIEAIASETELISFLKGSCILIKK